MSTIAIVGAGSGLGLAIARVFGRHGFNVALVARNSAKLAALVDELREADIEAAGFVADVMDLPSVEKAFAEVNNRFGDIDVLEYSPAPHSPVSGLSNPKALDADRGSIQPQIDYYLYGGLTAARQVLSSMLERGRGTILFTTGGTSMDPLAGPSEFSATTIGSGSLRAYALKLHQDTLGTGVYVAHIPIFAWIGQGGTGSEPDSIAEHYWDVYLAREGAERPYNAL